MRIQHNISALNSLNQLSQNDSAVSKNIQKLSSGYRINSAADDAAGLAVSEKMRSQINGLNQAENNVADGISLVQTAEGGLNETESILQRMNELAVESANGTYQDSTDRSNLNKEITALKSEIDRISTSTNFNQINLLDGSLQGYSVTVASALTSATVSSVTLSGGNLAAGDALTITIAAAGAISITTASSITGLSFTTDTAVNGAGSYTLTASVNYGTAGAVKADLQKYDGLSITISTGASFVTGTAATGAVTVSSNNSLSLQIGSDNKYDQRVALSVADMSSTGLGINGVDISTQADAESAIDTIKTAINTVSATRADLGALQNRLEHTTNNLSTMTQNLTSAESTIRDVDMSAEYVQYSKNQILSQAATSMLAQANAQPQNVLTLLRS